jgi:putative 4-mercaptohistidine N1-methyltranferase
MPWSWPAEVTYHEAKAFAAWQSQQEGMSPDSPAAYRMLTEAEHHCLRDQLPSGDRVLWCTGEHYANANAAPKSTDEVQPHGHHRSPATTTTNGAAVAGAANANLAFGSCSPVDALPPSTSGHYDVSGNAWQWTEDHFNPLPGFQVHPYYDDFSAPCFDGRHHVIMGGSFASTGQEASLHARYHFRPHFLQHSGFRLVSQPQGECPSTLLAASFEEAQAAAEASAAEAAATAAAAIKAAAAAAAPNTTSASSAPKSKVSGTGVKIAADSKSSNNSGGGGSGGDTPVYETQALLDMYLGLHFPASNGQGGQGQDVAPLLAHENAPHHALRFPQRVAKLLAEHALTSSSKTKEGPTRALDVGCAVGGSSFELATSFDEVVGFDFSASFVQAAQAMQRGESLSFKVPIEGDYQAQVTATHEPNVSSEARARCSFHTGDACALLDRHQAQDPLLNGQFDGAVVANLLCRLPKPRAFLDGLAAVLKPGGVAVVVTPYSWLDEFTPPEEWLGGAKDAVTGKHVAAKDVLEQEMNQRGLVKVHEEQVPLVIREHQRKYQYIVSEATVWRKQE